MSENCKPVTFLSALAATSKRKIQEYIMASRWSHLHIQISIDPCQRSVISFLKSASPNDNCSYKHCSVKEFKNTNFDREPDPKISKYASTPAILFTLLLSTSGGTRNQQSANTIYIFSTLQRPCLRKPLRISRGVLDILGYIQDIRTPIRLSVFPLHKFALIQWFSHFISSL
jgi:hypothetical protein